MLKAHTFLLEQSEVMDWPIGLLADWRDIAQADPTATVFSGPTFQVNLWRCFNPHARALTIAVYDEHQRPQGLISFMMHRPKLHGLPVSELSFLRNAHTVRNHIFLRAEADPKLVLSSLFAELRRVGKPATLYFDNLPVGTPGVEDLIEVLTACGYRCDPAETGRNLRYSLLPDTWDQYTAQWSRNFRSQIKKFHRKADEAGTVEYCRYGTRQKIAEYLDDFFAVKNRSWQAARSGLQACDGDENFVRCLVDKLPDNELGELWIMRVDHRPVAALQMLGGPGKLYVHTMHYDPEFEALSPGTLLFEAMVKSAIERGLQEIDCHGDSLFFRRWARCSRSHIRLRAYDPGPRGIVLQTLRRVFRNGDLVASLGQPDLVSRAEV